MNLLVHSGTGQNEKLTCRPHFPLVQMNNTALLSHDTVPTKPNKAVLHSCCDILLGNKPIHLFQVDLFPTM